MITRNPRRAPPDRGFPPARPAPRLYRNIAAAFLAFTVAVVGVAVWMSMVRATVQVQVEHEPVTLDVTVELAEQPSEGQINAKVVEGVFDAIKEFTVEETSVAEAVATTTGRVRITNRYSKDQPLIKTTRLLTADNRLFRINRTVTVPSGGSVDVEAYSDGQGSDYLVAKGTEFTIPGLWIDLQPLIRAEALADFEGQMASRKAVSKADIEAAQGALEQEVLGQAKTALAAEAGITEDQIGDTCEGASCWTAVYVVDALEEKSNVKAGQETDAFLAQVKLNVNAVFYPRSDMEAFVRARMKEKMPEGRELVDVEEQRIVYQLAEADAALKIARVRVHAEASSRLTDRSPLLSPDAVAGLSVEEAKQKLLGIPGTEFVEVTLRPAWARRIPRSAKRIDIVIK